MTRDRLVTALEHLTGTTLASELVNDFLKVRHDYATKTLERASPGKFVESFVQCLQQISTGTHELHPNIDRYFSREVENSRLPDGLRICGSRIARSMYALRSKRNIAHKGEVDPNTFDLAFLHQGAAWIMAELIRNASGVSMQEAGSLVELVQTPITHIVEEIDGTRLVHADASIRVKILILLHSCHPEYVEFEDIQTAVGKASASSLRSRISELRSERLIFGNTQTGYRLTSPGHIFASKEIYRLRG